MFEYIGRLRNPTFSQEKVPNVIETGRIVHKQNNFVSAADIFNQLTKEQAIQQDEEGARFSSGWAGARKNIRPK